MELNVTREDAEIAEQGRRARRVMWLFLAYPLAMIAGGIAIKALRLGWIGAVVMVVLGAAGMIALVRTAQNRTRALGCISPAQLRYNRRMMVAGIAYMATFLAATYAYRALHAEGLLLWAVVAGPTLAVMGMVWAMARLMIEETDEYLRMRMAVQGLVGTAGLLIAATIWGFLEQFGLLPHAPVWLALPVFAICMGVYAMLPKAKA